MDVHQKKALKVGLVLTILIYASLFFVFDISILVGFILLIILGVLGGLFLLINRWMKPHLNAKEYPTNNWYRTHLDRNYDAIVLGDDIAVKSFDLSVLNGKKYLDLSLSNQNLFADFAVLKNSFSILKPGGILYLPLREASIKYLDMEFKDERRYYWALSPYVFNHSALSCTLKKIYTRIPALLFRLKDMEYLLLSIFVKDIRRYLMEQTIREEQAWLKTCKSKEELRQKLESMLTVMNDFCSERDIKLKVLYV